MQLYKNIIFDLGAVLLDIDLNRSIKAFGELGFPDFDALYSLSHANHLFDSLEKGQISNEEFYAYFIEKSNRNLQDSDIQHAWNALLLSFRMESLDFLNHLGKNHRLFLLSNTNAIHKKAFEEIYKRQTGKKNFNDLFEHAYYSHELGMRKPNEEIFEKVLNDATIKKEETLFIDDLKANVDAASSMGFAVHHLLPKQRVEQLPQLLSQLI